MITLSTHVLEQEECCRINGCPSHSVAFSVLKRQYHDNQWFFFSHFAWGKMAAIGQDRGKWHLLNIIVFSREAVCPADRSVMVWCPRYLRKQSPFLIAPKWGKNHWISWHTPFTVILDPAVGRWVLRYIARQGSFSIPDIRALTKKWLVCLVPKSHFLDMAIATFTNLHSAKVVSKPKFAQNVQGKVELVQHTDDWPVHSKPWDSGSGMATRSASVFFPNDSLMKYRVIVAQVNKAGTKQIPKRRRNSKNRCQCMISRLSELLVVVHLNQLLFDALVYSLLQWTFSRKELQRATDFTRKVLFCGGRRFMNGT